MNILTGISGMQRRALAWRRQGKAVALVPTMGSLHEGHLSLVRRARKAVGLEGRVVVSLFVNPSQFGPKEDFRNYPRDQQTDAALCRQEGVDVLFAPTAGAMYPQGFDTWVDLEQLTQGMEGQSRPGHFRGVATVVLKLFNITLPDLAVFGAKDYQQAISVKRMVQDLNLSIRMVIAPTVREKDGLAMSSRNRYLTSVERPQATVLWHAIKQAKQWVKLHPQGGSATQLKRTLLRTIQSQPDVEVDYIELFDPESLIPVKKVFKGHHLAMAIRLGATRLIDNARLA